MCLVESPPPPVPFTSILPEPKIDSPFIVLIFSPGVSFS
jgi:hypothetical protein